LASIAPSNLEQKKSFIVTLAKIANIDDTPKRNSYEDIRQNRLNALKHNFALAMLTISPFPSDQDSSVAVIVQCLNEYNLYGKCGLTDPTNLVDRI
jgi:hypothetical protein